MIANRFKPISDYGRLGGLSDSIADAFTLLFAPAHVPEPSLKLSYTPSSLMLMLIYHTTMKRLQELYLSFKSNYKDDERDSDYESEIDSCEVVDMTGISEDRRCPMTHIIETPSASCHACSHLDPEKVSTTGEKGMREIIIVSPEKRYPRYIEMEGGLKTKQYTNMMKNWRYWISNDQWNKMYLAEQKYIDLLDVPGEQLYVLLAGLLQSVIARMVKQHYAQAINLLQKCECLCLRMEGNNSTFLHGRCKYTWSWLYRYLKQYEAAKECSRNAMQILFYVEPGEDKALANYGYAATIVDLQSTTKCPDQDEIQSAESYLQCAIDYAHIEDCGLEYVAPHSQLRLAQMYLHSTLYEPGKNTDPESIRKANSCLKAIDKGSLHPRSRCIFFLTESDLYRCKGDITMAKESAKQALMTAKENYFGEIMAAETRIKSLGLATSTKSFLVQ